MSLNFDSLAVNDIDVENIKGASKRQSAVYSTPIWALFKETAETGKGKAITVTNDDEADQLKRLVAMAASELGTGRKVRSVRHDNGTVTVMFASAPIRKRRTPEEIEADKLVASVDAHPAGKSRK